MRIVLYMKQKTNYSQYKILTSKHLNLLDFFSDNPYENCIQRYFKNDSNNSNENITAKFIEFTYNYVLKSLNKYSNKFSNHIYTQPKLFTILALKSYLNTTYRGLIEELDLMDSVKNFLGLKKVPHYTTIQKFFKRLSSKDLKMINEIILDYQNLEPENIALDGTGYTSGHCDIYYARRCGKKRKGYIKNHIAIDTKSQLILNYNANRGPKHDSRFAISSIKQLKKYKPHYILADKAYDTEPIRQTINEYVGAFDQIPLKTRAKTGHYRINSPTIFRPLIYAERNLVETVNSVMKRKFGGELSSKSTELQNKETKFKDLIYNIYRTTII